MGNKPLIIFGASTLSSLAAYSLVHDAGRKVAAFSVDAGFVGTGTHDGLPLVAFDHLTRSFAPADYDILIPLGWKKMNALRQERCAQAKSMGYSITNYVSSSASVWPGMAVGENVFIYERSILQPFVSLGENVTVRAGANLGHHSKVGSHSFIASGVVTGGNVTIGERCFIGLGAVLRDGIRIGDRCFVGAGAVVIADTEPDCVYVGNPARKLDKNSLEVTGGRDGSPS